MARPAIVLFLGLIACASKQKPSSMPAAPAEAKAEAKPEAKAEPAFEWPVPPGWRSETIPFPLGFAPELPYRGVEEIRFAPGFFDPKAPDFWSYVFLWSLEGSPSLSTTQLSADLRVYFVGLARAVADGKFDTHPSAVRVELADAEAPRPGASAFRGTLHVFDAFKTQRGLDLRVEGQVFRCGSRHILLLTASPQPADSPLWNELRACAAAFRCLH